MARVANSLPAVQEYKTSSPRVEDTTLERDTTPQKPTTQPQNLQNVHNISPLASLVSPSPTTSEILLPAGGLGPAPVPRAPSTLSDLRS